MNELRSLPINLSFPQLKTLNLNRNQDLSALTLSYCPLLDYISCSYCSLTSLGTLSGCPSLTFLDVSFNKIESLDSLLRSLHLCKNLQSIVYKDNLFNEHEHDQSDQVQEMKRTQHLHLLRLFTQLNRINLESVDEMIEKSEEVRESRKRQMLIARHNMHSDQQGTATEASQFLNSLAMCAQFRNYIYKMNSSKIRITFHSTTDLMKF